MGSSTKFSAEGTMSRFVLSVSCFALILAGANSDMVSDFKSLQTKVDMLTKTLGRLVKSIGGKDPGRDFGLDFDIVHIGELMNFHQNPVSSVTSWQDCFNECKKNEEFNEMNDWTEGCKFWSWEHRTSECYLMIDLDGSYQSVGDISGPVDYEPEQPIDYESLLCSL